MEMNPITIRPVSGTQEWAEHNLNIVNGCSHDCKYCYAKAIAIRFGRKRPETWKEEEVKHELLLKRYRKKEGRIMFPTSHDITPQVYPFVLPFLKKLLETGNDLLIVSKPHLSCIVGLCREFVPYRNQIVYRFTIGSPSSNVLKFWEPGAPSFEERLACLAHAFNGGYNTSVSIEPMLDYPEKICDLVQKLLPFVTDSIWLGKPNRVKNYLSLDHSVPLSVYEELERLESFLTDEAVLKLYRTFAGNPKVKWKDSIKQVVGITRPTEKGLDV